MDLSTDYTLTINGDAVHTAELVDVINPATGKPFAKAPKAGQAELDAAVDAAQSALQGWKALGWEGRREKLMPPRAPLSRIQRNLPACSRWNKVGPMIWRREKSTLALIGSRR